MRGYRYAGLWRRAAAAIINAVLLATLMLFALVVWITLAGEAHAWDSDPMALAFSACLLTALLLKVMLDALLGGTPGLHLLDCRLADATTGRRIGIGRAALRSLAITVSLLPLLLGLLWIAWDRRGQAWHDKLARTVVLREDDAQCTLSELAGAAR